MSAVLATPGPWHLPHFARADCKCECGYIFSDHQQGQGSICNVNYGGENEPRDIAIANARLIAAAPDLLNALQQAWVALSRCPYGSNVSTECLIAQAAIAKATGAQS